MKVKGIKPDYKVFSGFTKTSLEVPLKDLPDVIPEGDSIILGLEIWLGNTRTERGFLQCHKSDNRVYGVSTFSDKDITGELLEGSSAFSSVENGNMTMLVMSDNRLNSPYFKYVMENNLVAYTNRKQKKIILKNKVNNIY